MKSSPYIFIAIVLAVLSGCRSVADGWSTTIVTLKGGRAANRSWQENLQVYAYVPNRSTFEDGYKSGYAHTLAGRDSNQPPFPMSAAGKGSSQDIALVQTWLDGFSHGALAASQDRAARHQIFDTTTLSSDSHSLPSTASSGSMPVPPLPTPIDHNLPENGGITAGPVVEDEPSPSSGPIVRYSVSVGL